MKTLVAVFSASGVTKRVGEEIARVSVSEEELQAWIDGLQ